MGCSIGGRAEIEQCNYFVFVILHSMITFCFSSCTAPFPGQTQQVSESLCNCLCVRGNMCICMY